MGPAVVRFWLRIMGLRLNASGKSWGQEKDDVSGTDDTPVIFRKYRLDIDSVFRACYSMPISQPLLSCMLKRGAVIMLARVRQHQRRSRESGWPHDSEVTTAA